MLRLEFQGPFIFDKDKSFPVDVLFIAMHLSFRVVKIKLNGGVYLTDFS